jgi:hypothetical protein
LAGHLLAALPELTLAGTKAGTFPHARERYRQGHKQDYYDDDHNDQTS